VEVPFWKDRLEGTRVAFESELRGSGFERDDGEEDRPWIGPIPVPISETYTVGKRHKVLLPEDFPFSAPLVATTSPPTKLTWHLNPGGTLCLFRSSDDPGRPWETVDGLFDRVTSWYRNRRAGWPHDPGDPDLERYFESKLDFLVTYDSSEHATGPLGVIERAEDWYQLEPGRDNRKSRRRGHSPWGFGADLGVLDDPIWNWPTLRKVLPGDQLDAFDSSVRSGPGLLLLHYGRSGTEGIRRAAMVLWVKPAATTKAKNVGRVTIPPQVSEVDPTLRALETADVSSEALRYRSGPNAVMLHERCVAIVGCGAIGSFIADLLARSGVGRLHLVDPQRLRPGNCVRHLADQSQVPKFKVDAVKHLLVGRGLIKQGNVTTAKERLRPEMAFEMLTSADLVIDAAADASATGVLRHIADQIGNVTFLKVALHRDGEVLRIDRYGQGTPSDSDRPEFVPAVDTARRSYREAGCGDPVSPTPPDAVTLAAATACRWAIDQMRPRRRRQLPDSYVQVLIPQPDDGYDIVGSAGR
jgi:molybdopterin/thiamine biosynthesis adenylyltransferase